MTDCPAPRIDGNEVKLLWEDNYWDGPLSGIAEYKGERFYFSMLGTDVTSDTREYLLIRLTPEELAMEEAVERGDVEPEVTIDMAYEDNPTVGVFEWKFKKGT